MGDIETRTTWRPLWFATFRLPLVCLPLQPFPDAHGHSHGSHAAHGPEGMFSSPESGNHEHADDPEKQAAHLDNAAAQIIGVAILEFGVILHRYCHQNNLTSFVWLMYRTAFSSGLP